MVNSKEKASKSKKVTLTCEYCNKDFTMLKSIKRARENQNGKPIKFCSKQCSGQSRTILEKKECKNCKVIFKPSRTSNEYCTKECFQEYVVSSGIRKRNGYWFENGYKVLYTENGKGVKEHIKIMEDHIGRKLREDEVVHHINEDRLDNRIENLQLMTRSEHSSLHRKLEIKKGKKLFTRDS